MGFRVYSSGASGFRVLGSICFRLSGLYGFRVKVLGFRALRCRVQTMKPRIEGIDMSRFPKEYVGVSQNNKGHHSGGLPITRNMISCGLCWCPTFKETTMLEQEVYVE